MRDGTKQSGNTSRFTGYLATLNEPQRLFQFYKVSEEENMTYAEVLLPSVRREENHEKSRGRGTQDGIPTAYILKILGRLMYQSTL
jgi:hypothetical protein